MKQFNPRRLSRLNTSIAAALIAVTAPAATYAKDKFEPFVAGAQIAEAIGPSSDPACQPSPQGVAVQGTITGSGWGTPIGAFTVMSVDCIRSTNPYALTPPFAFSSMALTLTALNGDQLVASYSGTGELNASGLLVLSGTFTITGGTGQFRKAEGSGTVAGVEDLSTNPARGFVTLTGQISR